MSKDHSNVNTFLFSPGNMFCKIVYADLIENFLHYPIHTLLSSLSMYEMFLIIQPASNLLSYLISREVVG